MMLEQALGIVASLVAYFPRARIPDESRAAWATALTEHDAIDALVAVNELGRSSIYLPSLAEVLAACRAARRDRLANLPDRMLLAPGRTVAEVARAKLRLVQAGASPADDPPWTDDTPAEGVTFGEFLQHHATPEQRRTASRVAPTLARYVCRGPR